MGMVSKDPNGNMKSMAPSSASFSPNRSLTSGILDAQLEKTKPEKKKYKEMATLGMVYKCAVVIKKGT
jgi:hypothetical protein